MKKFTAIAVSVILVLCSSLTGVSALSGVSTLGTPEFYAADGSLVQEPNHFAATSLSVNGEVASQATAGTQFVARVDYDTESTAYLFEGWFKDGTLVSSDNPATITADETGGTYIPRIRTYNILSTSASFENYSSGQSVLVSGTDVAPENGLWGYCRNAGYNGSGEGAAATVKNTAALQQTFTGATVPSGANALYLDMNYRTAFYGFTVTPNTDYTISLKWISKSEKQLNDAYYGLATSYISTTYQMENPGAQSTVGANILAISKATDSTSDGVAWQTKTLQFNSGEYTTLYLALASHSDGTASGKVQFAVDDLVCVQRTVEKASTVLSAEFAEQDGTVSRNHYAPVTALNADNSTNNATSLTIGTTYKAKVTQNPDEDPADFLGWFKRVGEFDSLLTTEKTVTFVAARGEKVVPKFNSKNVLGAASSFEGEEFNAPKTVTDVTMLPQKNLWGFNKNGGYFGYTFDGIIYDKTGKAYQQTASTSSAVDATPTAYARAYMCSFARAKTGTKSLAIDFSARTASLAMSVEKNKNYVLSFYWWYAAGQNATIQSVSVTNTINVGSEHAAVATDGSGATLQGSYGNLAQQLAQGYLDNSANVADGTWQKVTMEFNSGNFNNLYLAITPTASTQRIYMDDLVCYEKISSVEAVGEPEFYEPDGSKSVAPNHYAKVSLAVDGVPTEAILEGNTVTATVDYDKASRAYSFLGWYKNDTLVSTDEVFTFTATDGEVYVPRIASTNILPTSASFEGEAIGTNKNVLDITAFPGDDGRWGANNNAGYYGYTYAGTVYDMNGKAYTQTASAPNPMPTSFQPIAISDAAAHSGRNSLQLTLNYRTASLGFSVQKNTKYNLTFYWLAAGGVKFKECGISNTVNLSQNTAAVASDSTQLVGTLANLMIRVCEARQVISTASDGSTWQKVSLVFDSKNYEKLYFLVSPNTTEQIFIDDLVCEPVVPAAIDLDMKSCADVAPIDCDFDNMYIGQTGTFKVLTAPGATPPVVKAGEQVLTADANGVYTFTVENATQNLSIRLPGDASLNDHDKDYSGRDLSHYNEDVYLTDIWSGNTVYHETALFTTGRETVKLLYPVDKVVSLRSYDLKTNYVQGLDYDVTADGLIQILPGSRIPIYAGELVRTAPNAYPVAGAEGQYLAFIGDTTYPQYAIAVTYTHSTTFADGYQPAAPASQTEQMQNTMAKLKAGEDVNIVIYGDSISCGWSSSGLNNPTSYDTTNTEGNFKPYSINVAPYAPTWMDMFISKLSKQYPDATIHVKNLALGGQASYWGRENIAARLALWKDENGNQVTPDLMLVGFGVNDAPGVPANTFKIYNKGIVTNARTASGNADMEVLFFSPMLPNQKATAWNENFMMGYEQAMDEIAAADAHVGLVKLTSIYTSIIDSKEAVDYLNTNVNHGNDFTARVYATGILSAFKEIEVVPEAAQKGNQFEFKGVSIRTSGVQALRFKFSLPTPERTLNYADGYNLVEYGSIVLRTALLGGNELVCGGTYLNGATPGVGVSYNAAQGKDLAYSISSANVVFTAALINISIENYSSSYTVRPYAKYQKDDKVYIVYGEEQSAKIYETMQAIEDTYLTYKTAQQACPVPFAQVESDYQKLIVDANETVKTAFAAWKSQNA